MSHAITVPPGRGGGGRSGGSSGQTQTGPQDGDLQSGTDNSEAMAELAAQEAMAVQGAQEAMAGGPRGRGLIPLGPAPTAGTLLPPQKKIPWGS